MTRWPVRFGQLALCAVVIALAPPAPGQAQDFDQASCDEFLLPLREVKGKKVGPASCLMQETDITFEGRTFRRLDIGLDGSVEGYLTKTGDYKEYLTNAPDLVFPQTADPADPADQRPVLFAVAAYRRDKGASMTVIYPIDKAAWNSKMWVTAHGRGSSFKEGQLKRWNKNLNTADPLSDLNKYDKLMLAKGYVLVKTRRTSTEGLGEIVATLEDGSTVDYAAFNDTARYVMDFTTVAEKALERRLGTPPARTYFYGHSAGARIGRGLNYTPGLNRRNSRNNDASGKPLFDAILADDGAAGGWLPVLMRDGKDVLLATDPEKAAFVPQLDISHQMYNNVWNPTKPVWMSSSFLENKRRNARILRDKGLATKARMYEVRSISHDGGEDPGGRPEIQTLDLSKLMDRFLDMLDAWADKGTAPPPTRSDWAELGDVDRDGTIEHPGLAMPEAACPLGVYHPYPNSKGWQTSFAPFTGDGLEPLDEDEVFVDMNRNGIRDPRETPTEAWRRLGLLQRNEDLTRENYVACVSAAADALQKDGFFSEATARGYRDQAGKVDLSPRAGAR